jgi:hypothetical protein
LALVDGLKGALKIDTGLAHREVEPVSSWGSLLIDLCEERGCCGVVKDEKEETSPSAPSFQLV